MKLATVARPEFIGGAQGMLGQEGDGERFPKALRHRHRPTPELPGLDPEQQQQQQPRTVLQKVWVCSFSSRFSSTPHLAMRRNRLK